MAKRERIGGSYVKRRSDGTFLDWTNIGKSIAMDKRKITLNKPKKPGYGHKGDY